MEKECSLPKLASTAGPRNWQEVGLGGYVATVMIVAGIMLVALAAYVVNPVINYIMNTVFHGPIAEEVNER